MLRETEKGLWLPVKVIPNARKTEIEGWKNEELVIRLNAQPEKGRANKALIQLLSKMFKLAKSRITLHKGQTSRHKILLLDGISKQELLAAVTKLISKKDTAR